MNFDIQQFPPPFTSFGIERDRLFDAARFIPKWFISGQEENFLHCTVTSPTMNVVPIIEQRILNETENKTKRKMENRQATKIKEKRLFKETVKFDRHLRDTVAGRIIRCGRRVLLLLWFCDFGGTYLLVCKKNV